MDTFESPHSKNKPQFDYTMLVGLALAHTKPYLIYTFYAHFHA